MSEQEKKDKKFSIIMTSAVYGLFILLLIFLVAWRPLDPPVEEYGIELNFGFQAEGGGDLERDAEAQIEETTEDTPPDSEVETEQTETQAEEVTPVEEVVEEVVEPEPEIKEEVTPAKVEAEKAPEKPPVEKVIEDPITTNEESEVKVEEATPVKKEIVEEKPPVEEKKEEVKPKPKPVPEPTLDSRALMGGKKKDSDSKEAASNNQGLYPDKKGNQGDPEGNKKTDGINPDGSDIGSVSYSLDGWKWERPPAEKDESQIDGVIKFGIDVDDRGKVLRVSVLPGTTISDNTIVEFYKKQVLKLSFIQTNASNAPAPISKGEVTFVIKTN